MITIYIEDGFIDKKLKGILRKKVLK